MAKSPNAGLKGVADEESDLSDAEFQPLYDDNDDLEYDIISFSFIFTRLRFIEY